MALGLDIPFQNTLSNKDDRDKKKKRKTLYDDYKQAKEIYDKTRKIVGILRNPALLWPIIIIGIVIFIALFLDGGTPVGGLGGSNATTPTEGTPITVPSIPGLNVDLEATPTEAPNDPGLTITYIVTITHNPSVAPPIETIELYDDLPSGAELVSTTGVLKSEGSTPNVWPLSDPANQTRFEIVIRPNAQDTNFRYTISARRVAGNTPVGGSSGNACTEPYEGTGYCSVEYLATYFGGDESKALIASIICQKESGSNPFNHNYVCPDYSIGLFQINLVAHCPGAYANLSCTQLIDVNKRNTCEAQLEDPIANIQKMLDLSGGTYWTPWSTWPPTQSILQDCDIL